MSLACLSGRPVASSCPASGSAGEGRHQGPPGACTAKGRVYFKHAYSPLTAGESRVTSATWAAAEAMSGHSGGRRPKKRRRSEQRRKEVRTCTWTPTYPPFRTSKPCLRRLMQRRNVCWQNRLVRQEAARAATCTLGRRGASHTQSF